MDWSPEVNKKEQLLFLCFLTPDAMGPDTLPFCSHDLSTETDYVSSNCKSE